MIDIIIWAILIAFFIWQIKMLRKYVLQYDRFKLDVAARQVEVNKERIILDEIAAVTVRELEQPSAWEKALSKSAAYAYMAQLVFQLKSGYEVTCKFNKKGTLYKALKQLSPLVPVNANIEDYKPHTNWVAVCLVLIIVVVLIVMVLSAAGRA